MPKAKKTKSVSLDLLPSDWDAWKAWCHERGFTMKAATLQAIELYKRLPGSLRSSVNDGQWESVESVLAFAEKRIAHKVFEKSIGVSGGQKKGRTAGSGPSA